MTVETVAAHLVNKTPAVYIASPSTLSNGEVDVLQTDAVHNLKVGGSVTEGSTATGNPVRTAGVDNAGLVQSLLTDGYGNLQAVSPVSSAWSVTQTAAAAGQATQTKAAGGAGVKNVITGFVVQLGGDGTGNADHAIFNIRDGATGTGTVLLSIKSSLAAGANAVTAPVVVTGIQLVGTANTAMTIEASTVGATNTIQRVSAWGYQTK